MKNWTDLLKTNEVSNEFKIIIKDFLIPDNIFLNQYFANLQSLNYEIPFLTPFMKVSKSLSMSRVFPQSYPVLIIAAYPDVIVNLLNYPEKSNIWISLTEDSFYEMQVDPSKKYKFFRLLINEYKLLKSPILECTEQFILDEEKSKLKYPIRTYDNLGRLELEVTLLSGFEVNAKHIYNDNNQILRIDKWGDDAFGEWKLFPYKFFEYEDNGLLTHYIEYQHGGIVEDLKYFYEYDNNNNVMLRDGPKLVLIIGPSKIKRTWPTSRLLFHYEADYVEIIDALMFENTKHKDAYIIEKVKRKDLADTVNSFTGISHFDINKEK